MAEAGAHLTSAAARERPSIFEVLAQESLMAAVRPALRHGAKVLAESDPPRFGFLWRRFDELHLLLDLLLQHHFLSRCGASFSENFYGLKRVWGGRGLGLRGGRRWRSLLLLCLAPYLRAKLDAALARQRDEEDFSIRLEQSGGRRLYRAAAAAWPYAGAAWRAWAFCQQLLFVFGAAGTHDPLLWLARVRLARLDAQDLRDVAPRGSRPGNPAEGSLASLSASLSLGVFFLRFLEWWYSSADRDGVKSLAAPPAPPPPLHLQGGPDAPPPGECPLCGGRRSNATALSTSGFVFCYRCVFAYVKANRRCPLSGVPTEPQHLVKIYCPES
ncbi:peroxisome assembly protein 12 [Pseudoliparis swirei]|uniref:peroxisome assembly protein 12 n=1 Tax=Pseudoliparis swirei TaxID=2059687 RepID=UPI0024BEB06A|nr:peroxisome assembly protein 12 [Pseudoliparis swirei]XP_056263916.1 peroxisome assembly protein 12 [Pseudoliparis swirei]XP_056263917.1 peroxisome assembly protein 12 [Pseudoliparis swirei]